MCFAGSNHRLFLVHPESTIIGPRSGSLSGNTIRITITLLNMGFNALIKKISNVPH